LWVAVNVELRTFKLNFSPRTLKLLVMKADVIRQLLDSTKPPLEFFTSDGRTIYVDHPESVLVSENLVAIGSGAGGTSVVIKEIILISPDHVVRVEPTKRRALRRVAPSS
jgi:hypothetical protein